MKPTIEELQDSFKYSYEQFRDSRQEATKAFDYFHNRQYDLNQLAILAERGQPAETFNVVKRYSRMLIGFLSTVVNTVRVKAKQQRDIETAAVLGDVIDQILIENNFESESIKVKLDCILTGMMALHFNVRNTGKRDPWGREIRQVEIDHVPIHEIVPDPMSKREDYEDARFMHRFKWISEEELVNTFGNSVKDKLEAYENFLSEDDTDFSYSFNGEFQGRYKRYDNYLVVHSVLRDEGKTWSVFWSGDQILSKKQVKYNGLRFPYRLHKLHSSIIPEYYGLFREIFETQDAINQAIIKIQLAVNSQKAFVQEGAVENIEEFKNTFNRVNAVCEVKNINGVRIENTTREIQDLYGVVDRALDRIQSLLCINDSFLGLAPASDSGIKVQKQQNATVVALEHLTQTLKSFYRLMAWDVLRLVQQFYTHYQVWAIADEFEGDRYVAINAPYVAALQDPETGEYKEVNLYEEVIDPETGDPVQDEEGNFYSAPIPTRESEIMFTEADIRIESVAYNNEIESNMQLFESFLNGNLGKMLGQIDPVSYLKVGALALRQLRTKVSPEIARVLEEAAKKIETQQAAPNPMMQGVM